jgi:uncharacterized protein (DUF2141 family)
MNKLYLVLVFGAFVSLLNAQSKVQVEITDIHNDQGCIMLELLDTNQKQVMHEKGVIKDGKCSITINSIANGKYAIRYFHDENANGELDKNFMGIPKEGYGFSNDAYGNYGPKDFEEWIFRVENTTNIELKTAYL